MSGGLTHFMPLPTIIQRFKAPKTNFEPIRDPHHLATVALNQELAAFMPPPVERRAMRYDTLFLL
jgi:hypothetical protein